MHRIGPRLIGYLYCTIFEVVSKLDVKMDEDSDDDDFSQTTRPSLNFCCDCASQRFKMMVRCVL